MKKTTGIKIVGVIVSVIVAAGLGVGSGFLIDSQNNSTDTAYTIHGPSEQNGNIGDHVKGSDKAQVLIFEYADYQCPGCAKINPEVNAALEKVGDKAAVIYRSFILSYHQNGDAAARAVEAAGLQGYWKPYANKMFESQAEWEYATAGDLGDYLDAYFNEVTGGKGDLEKFHNDQLSDAVTKKIEADNALANHVNISATPAFYVDGQMINWTKAGHVVINGHTVSWEDSIGNAEGLAKLFNDIADAKGLEAGTNVVAIIAGVLIGAVSCFILIRISLVITESKE